MDNKKLATAKYTMAPADIAKYFLVRAVNDGELVSPLKMQKLVYYAYALYLVKEKKRLFDESIEAWANGPVVPSLYKDLKSYGSQPIDDKFLPKKPEEFVNAIPGGVKTVLDQVYERYMTMTAFELVTLTHNEKPWVEARRGLAAGANSEKPLSDQYIIEQFGG